VSCSDLEQCFKCNKTTRQILIAMVHFICAIMLRDIGREKKLSVADNHLTLICTIQGSSKVVHNLDICWSF